jgi:hypothetical protein
LARACSSPLAAASTFPKICRGLRLLLLRLLVVPVQNIMFILHGMLMLQKLLQKQLQLLLQIQLLLQLQVPPLFQLQLLRLLLQ